MATAYTSAAEAGPSSAPDGAGSSQPVQSYRQLYNALEAASSTTPKTAIQKRLQQLLPHLRAVAEPPRAPSAASKSNVESGRVAEHPFSSGKTDLDAALKECCFTCSELLHADEAEVALTMRVFLDSEDVSPEHLAQSSDALLSPGRAAGSRSRRAGQQTKRNRRASSAVTSSFVDAFCVYFLDERLYARRCISALLRISDDRFHDLYEVARSTLGEFADQTFGLHCIERARELAMSELHDGVREVPRYGTYWAKHRVSEQMALLEIVFLLYYSRLESTAVFVQAVLHLIKQTNFGNTQANAGFFDAEAGQLVECLAGLHVLLAIESLDVETTMTGVDLLSRPRLTSKGDIDTRNLSEAPDVILEAVSYLRSSTARDHLRAPLMVVWALYISRVDQAVNDWKLARSSEPLPSHLRALQQAFESHGGIGAMWTELASVALSPEIDLFTTMRTIATSALLKQDSRSSAALSMATSSSLALRAVLKGFVLAITELIRPEYVHDYGGLITLWEDTFENDSLDDRLLGRAADSAAALCAQFWEVDFEHEPRSSVLATATRRFPVSFRPLLRLCCALSGSSPRMSHTSDEALRASTAVLQYLSQIGSVTHVVPPSPSISLPFETVEVSSSDSVVYRATRTIPVFGKYLVIPSGTLGRMISQADQGPAVLTWDLRNDTVSVWRLLRDVLANFAGLLEPAEEFRKVRDASDASVFVERDAPANFALLAADEEAENFGDAAANAMNLIAALLNTSPQISAALIAHFEGQDMDAPSLSQPQSFSENLSPSLVSITLGILGQGLVSPSSASEVIISAYRLLTLFIKARSSDVWLPMRSSGILIGRHSASPFTGKASNLGSGQTSVSILSREVSIGKFAGLIAMLDFHLALIADLQQSLFACAPSELQIKTDVLKRAIRFVAEVVWPEYQSWKYARIRERIEIGNRCLQIFHKILADKALRSFEAPPRDLVYAVESIFVADLASPMTVAPLLEIIVGGQHFINSLLRAARQVEVELARELIESALRLAKTFVSCRRRVNTAKKESGHTPALGMIEAAFFDHNLLPARASLRSNTTVQSPELASVAFGYIFTVHAQGVRCEALQLITEVSRSVVDVGKSPSPAFITHLGSLDDVQSVMNRLVDLCSDDEESPYLRSLTWNMMAALVDSQPGIASLLLTGDHVASAIDIDTGKEREDPAKQPTKSHSLPGRRTAVTAAVTIVKDHSRGSVSTPDQPRILESALKFLTFAWAHVIEHPAAFAQVRGDKAFWNILAHLSFDTLSACDTSPRAIEISDSACLTDIDHTVFVSAYQHLCSARALHILTSDIQLIPLLQRQGGKTAYGESMSHVSALLSDAKRLAATATSVLKVYNDALRHDDVRDRLSQSFPEMPLDLFATNTRRDDFDTHKEYGCCYLYDLQELDNRLGSVVLNALDNSLDEDIVTQALLLVASVNLDWCMIDSQTCRLRAFTALLSAACGPLLDQTERDAALEKRVYASIEQAWSSGAQIVADEATPAPITRDIHALRTSFLAVLFEIGLTTRGSGRKGEGKYAATEAIQQAVRIITHPLFSVEDALRGAVTQQQAAYCRDAFRLILTSTSQYDEFRHAFDKKKEGDARVLQQLEKDAETLATHTITYAQLILSRSLASFGPSSATGEGADLIAGNDFDLQLLTRSLALLLRDNSGIAVHVWWPKMQTTALLETAFDLFSRTPRPQVASLSDDAAELAAGSAPPYWSTLLNFFLVLASNHSTSENVILAGIMNALSTNALSAAIDNSATLVLPPQLANTTVENPLHAHWIQILQVVVALLSTLAPAQALAFASSELTTFFRVFQPFLDGCLKRPLVDPNQLLVRSSITKSSGARQKASHTTSLSQLEETDFALRVYTHYLRTQSRQLSAGQATNEGLFRTSQRYMEALFQDFAANATMRLQEAVHLLQHPRELHALLGSGSSQGSAKTNKHSGEGQREKGHLLQICSSVVESFWLLSNGVGILTSADESEWDLSRVFIVPSIGTSLARPSSIGTLIDLATYTVDTMRSLGHQTIHEVSGALVAVLEQTLSLASTQLALVSFGRQLSSKTSPLNNTAASLLSDIEAGLGRDVGQSIEAGSSTLRELRSGNHSNEKPGSSVEYIDIVAAFHKRWNDSSET